MTQMVQEEIITIANTVIQDLESLKKDYTSILNGLFSPINVFQPETEDENLIEEKSVFIKENLNSVEMGLCEAQLMVALAAHLENVEAENSKLRSQVEFISRENIWLRDELINTQQKLQASEGNVAQLEEEKKYLELMVSVKNDENNRDLLTEELTCEKLETDHSLDVCATDDSHDGVQQANLFSTSLEQIEAASNTIYEIPSRIRTLHNLVIEYTSKGRYEIAVLLCKHFLEHLEKNYGHNHPDVATILNILALVYWSKNDYEEAINILNDSLDIRKNTLGYHHPAVAATLNNLAILYGKRGEYEEAAGLLNDALTIREKSLGESHPVVAATLNNLAILYGKEGKYKEAESLCKRALEIRETVLGRNHPDVAKQLNNLALLCQYQGKYAEVEGYYMEALDIYENSLGPNSHNVAKTKINLALACLKQGKYNNAEILYKEILTRDHKQKFGSLGGENNSIWKFAEEMNENKIMRNAPDMKVDSSTVATALKNLGALYRRQCKYGAAETLKVCAPRFKKEAVDKEKTHLKRESDAIQKVEKHFSPKKNRRQVFDESLDIASVDQPFSMSDHP